MLLDVQRILADNKDQETLERLVSILAHSIRETDVIGWYQNERVLGILFTEMAAESRGVIVSTMLGRVNSVLYNNLTFEKFNQIIISHHLFPERWDHDVLHRPSHPTLYPDLNKREEKKNSFSVTKRITDIVGSALGLLLGSVVFLLIAAAIKLTSSGPVFYRQVRVGQYGAPFVFLKFRSMYVDNDPAIHKDYVRALINGRAERKPAEKGNGIYKLTRDPRVTRVGAFIRKTSLDELPQLINVLKGEMSLVGPRPAIPYEVEVYNLWHRRRVLEAKPGITGLWQVKGRSRVTFDEMVRLDVQYAMKRSLWLDLKILMQTPRAVLQGAGAC